ncbi:type VI secretion system tip protein VgrG [Pseudomonas daroniae]|uniref:Type VI secretion system tip protein VgrG n=1 Tax=Phytopseudomonas daroniae TaxID=2487519 RepID=A0A4V2KAZ1_9GAMM|nr:MULTISPECIES: type VI secretion system tip protein VgrG [Pseudomonas]TBU75577.1 type VI secretion system tip protein VgrG [Pseudomonas daroniae]TBU81476.1 type VI secretion system tip protein VgrG [Pseudomonas daroniae]TBU84360.1 type VI secretion system tip protein VgrG [Pseudomonas sp. FRB 228]TBU89847.1 type VI secretion system tip protein VgrG [Pseudomonas daroniae]
MAITQQSRMAKVSSPLGENALVMEHLSGTESLGRLFQYELSLASENSSLKLSNLLGKPMGLAVQLADGSDRYFHGIVARCSQTAHRGQFASYQVSLKPWLWLLSRTSDCRIFQSKTVPEIIKQVFRDLGFSDFEDALTRSYREWDYCVQYRETSFDFVSRLMEQEGIYYYFRHEQERHVLVLCDAYGAHSTAPGYASVPFYPLEDQMRERDHIHDWHLAHEVQPGSLALNDYDFQRPSARLEVRSSIAREHSNADYPLYDYPGEYVQSKDGEQYARNRIEAIQAQYEQIRLKGNARGLGSGHLFSLTDYPRDDQNREYLIVDADYTITQDLYESGRGDEVFQFDSNLTCIDAGQVFRPLPLTVQPIVQGPQTAMVVGPKGEEIWTDQYGRVKVHFYWDRHDQSNENSSCWIRVSQNWAGKNWGSIQIPRIGQEVIVSFLEGDPDRPIITGRVYNAEQTVPYDLPANATQSGTKSRSSKGGTPANFNEIRMEDKKGEEQLFIHAEKNQDIEVENDETHWVGHDRSKTIDNDETVHVKHDRTETVDNNETITIGVDRTEQVGNNESVTIGVNRTEKVGSNEAINIGANRTETVGSNETITIGANRTESVGSNETISIGANRTESVGKDERITIGADRTELVTANESVFIGANQTMAVGGSESHYVRGERNTRIGKDDTLHVGKNFVLKAGDSITLQTGAASITMKKDGTIVIRGKNISIDGSGAINAKASKNIVMKGQKILQN